MNNLYEEVSGLDVFIRMFNGDTVQYWDCEGWYEANPFDWSVSDLKDGDYKFRVKRKVINNDVEIPQTFPPKYGEEYWYIFPSTEMLYKTNYEDDRFDEIKKLLGYYKTKEDALLAFKTLSKAITGE